MDWVNIVVDHDRSLARYPGVCLLRLTGARRRARRHPREVSRRQVSPDRSGYRASSPPAARPTRRRFSRRSATTACSSIPSRMSLFYRTASGDIINAKTGEKLAGVDSSSFKKVRVNNALRSAIDAALGSLTLANPDPAKRAAAADAVFKSRDPKALRAIETALSKETDARAGDALRQARAAILVSDPSALDRRSHRGGRGAEGARRPGCPEPARRGRRQEQQSRS